MSHSLPFDGSKISPSQVYVGDVFCGEVKYEVDTIIYEIDCGNAVGGNVKVVQNNQPLTLCEVQVVGAPSDEIPLVNIAPGGSISTGRETNF